MSGASPTSPSSIGCVDAVRQPEDDPRKTRSPAVAAKPPFSPSVVVRPLLRSTGPRPSTLESRGACTSSLRLAIVSRNPCFPEFSPPPRSWPSSRRRRSPTNGPMRRPRSNSASRSPRRACGARPSTGGSAPSQSTPTTPQAYNNLAVAYEHEGQFEKARKAYDKAAELEPNNAMIRQNFDLFKEINDRTNRRSSAQ